MLFIIAPNQINGNGKNKFKKANKNFAEREQGYKREEGKEEIGKQKHQNVTEIWVKIMKVKPSLGQVKLKNLIFCILGI